MFHASLLSPYHETTAHGPNFPRPPLDLIKGKAEYEVEQIQNHQHFRHSHALQYLIKWKGYPESDNTWEPADNIHTPDLLKAYQRKHINTSMIRALKTIPTHLGSSQPSRPNLLPTIHNPQVPQLCPWSSLPSNSCSLSQTFLFLH
jgi:hypothetical protein